MGAAPAIACGVSDISITSPAQNGILNSLTIAAKVAGIEKFTGLVELSNCSFSYRNRSDI